MCEKCGATIGCHHVQGLFENESVIPGTYSHVAVGQSLAILDGLELDAYAGNYSPEEVEKIRERWRRSAKRKTLIDAGVENA